MRGGCRSSGPGARRRTEPSPLSAAQIRSMCSLGPIAERLERFQQFYAGRGHRVLHPRRHLVIALAVHHAVALQFLEVLRQHLLRDPTRLRCSALNRLGPPCSSHRISGFHLPSTTAIAASRPQVYCAHLTSLAPPRRAITYYLVSIALFSGYLSKTPRLFDDGDMTTTQPR